MGPGLVSRVSGLPTPSCHAAVALVCQRLVRGVPVVCMAMLCILEVRQVAPGRAALSDLGLRLGELKANQA